MATYKDAISDLADCQIIDALNKYHQVELDLSDPEWQNTVLDYVRDNWRLEVDEDTGDVRIMGEEHRSYFGEFIAFDYEPIAVTITVAKQDSGRSYTWVDNRFNVTGLTRVAQDTYYGDGDTFIVKGA